VFDEFSVLGVVGRRWERATSTVAVQSFNRLLEVEQLKEWFGFIGPPFEFMKNRPVGFGQDFVGGAGT
jgi:hypothetical protein